MMSLPIVHDFSVPSSNRTLFLMHLNLAAYPSCFEGRRHGHKCGFADATMEDVWRQHRSLYGPSITNSQAEFDAANDFSKKNWDLLLSDPHLSHYQKHSVPSTTAEYQVGVQALEWHMQDAILLAFRGTYTPGDHSNIENWMVQYILELSTERMKQAWIQDAGLNWTQTMEEKSQRDDKWAKLEIRAVESFKRQKYARLLVETVAANQTLSNAIGGLSLNEVHETGYWKLTKYLVDQVAARAKETNRTLILTGHSQGGTRAQLASMYLHHRNNTTPTTITFAATGSTCPARLLFSNANLLADVDPYIQHDHLTDFVHPLDPWGNSMLGRDNGQVCYWGSNDDNYGDYRYDYCSQVYGWTGPTLIAAQGGAYAGTGAAQGKELTHNFQRCRYFTHSAEAMLLGLLSSPSSSLVEGQDNSNCHVVPVIPSDDPNGQCPTGNISTAEEEAIVWILVFSLAMLLGMIVCCRRCCHCCRPKPLEPTHTLLAELQHTGIDPESGHFRDEEEEDTDGIELLEGPVNMIQNSRQSNRTGNCQRRSSRGLIV